MILPLEKVCVRDVHHAKIGAIGWMHDRPGETFFIGKAENLVAVAFGEASLTSYEIWNLGGYASFVEAVQFEVDPSSYVPYDPAICVGALVIRERDIRLVALAPNGRPWLISIGQCEMEVPEYPPSAFTRWRAVTMVSGEAQTLFART